MASVEILCPAAPAMPIADKKVCNDSYAGAMTQEDTAQQQQQQQQQHKEKHQQKQQQKDEKCFGDCFFATKNIENNNNDNDNDNEANENDQPESSPPSSEGLTPEFARKVVRYANKKLKTLEQQQRHIQKQDNDKCTNADTNESEKQQKQQQHLVRKVKHSEIELGEVLGEGSFARVYAIKKQPTNDDSNNGNSSTLSKIDFSPFVVKMLKPKLLQQPKMFASCVRDMAKETFILSHLPKHDHVIQIQAEAEHGIKAFVNGRHDAYFMVLDRVESTLSEHIQEWQQQQEVKTFFPSLSPSNPNKPPLSPSHNNNHHHHSGSCGWFGGNNAPSRSIKHYGSSHNNNDKLPFSGDDDFYYRLELGVQLASAVAHLHSHYIMHRDLKPDNVGIDQYGHVKLFDFDVACLVKTASHDEVCSQLTKGIGTKRYMAPEVGLGLPYNISADVWSFTILLHFMLSLDRPFRHLKSLENLHELQHEVGLRPEIYSTWPKSLQAIMALGWSNSMSQRPKMKDYHDQLLFILFEEQQQQQQQQQQYTACDSFDHSQIDQASSSIASASMTTTTSATTTSNTVSRKKSLLQRFFKWRKNKHHKNNKKNSITKSTDRKALSLASSFKESTVLSPSEKPPSMKF